LFRAPEGSISRGKVLADYITLVTINASMSSYELILHISHGCCTIQQF